MRRLIDVDDAIVSIEEERFPIDSDYAEGFMAALDKVEWILKEWLPSAQPDKTYEQGWKDGQEALREEMWEDGRDRLDYKTGGD